MNTRSIDQRRSRDYTAYLEYLDDRIVPSTVQLNLIAADVATSHVSVNSAGQHEEPATAESQIEIRREIRMARIAERQEQTLARRERAIERREARLEEIAARQQFSPPVVAGSRVGPLNVTYLGSGASGSSTSGSSAGTGASLSPTAPVTTSPVTTTPATTSPVTTAPVTTPVLSSPVTTSPTAPLPAYVSALLDTVYEEFQTGTLPTTTLPGQVEVQGSNVGIQIHAGDPSDFASMVANAESLGLQVTTVSSTYDIVVGFLPIADLPAAAQLAGSLSITPTLAPTF